VTRFVHRPRAWQTFPVLGPIIIVVILLVAIPVGFLMTMGVVAAVLGTFLKNDADTRYEGSELLAIGEQG
jgi:hypothetical protein